MTDTNTQTVSPATLQEQLKRPMPLLAFDRITSVEDNRIVAQVRAEATRRLKIVDELCDKSITDANQAHKSALELKRRLAAGPQLAQTLCIIMQKDWDRREIERVDAEKRRREEEERQRTREAEEKAAREREAAAKKLADAKAAGDKIAAETARQELEAKKRAEQDVLSGFNQPETPYEPEPVIEKVKGMSTQQKWTADENVDMDTLIEAAAKDRSLRCYLLPHIKAMKNHMRDTSGKGIIPGVKATWDVISKQRGARD